MKEVIRRRIVCLDGKGKNWAIIAELFEDGTLWIDGLYDERLTKLREVKWEDLK